ncbi:uncharacterized protein An07g06930 [Aspergillus niger]|uniref:Contig An07c0190, genomic contig n=2 Tax=Aspergillus niger TaxID=5061 RepID=A2QNT4_ASPNC|nr:uncharacterized protein An07g06930 [Aspergillus niger]CAK39536.1 unnamed protein product [Aspergillus niger]
MQRAYRTSRDEKRTLELAHGRVSKAVISDFAMATGRLKTHQIHPPVCFAHRAVLYTPEVFLPTLSFLFSFSLCLITLLVVWSKPYWCETIHNFI